MTISKKVSMRVQRKINIIASGFGAKTGRKAWKRCFGDYRGTVDYSILFDTGESLFICNSAALSKDGFERYLDNLCLRYHPDEIQKTKEIALKNFRQASVMDNAKAAELGLSPYEVLSIELCTAGGQYIGWFYTRISVGGKIVNHLETGAMYAIKDRKPPNLCKEYFVAGALKEGDAEYVFHGVGFSTSGTLYKVQANTVAQAA
jgi:hypothetical protein